MLHDLSFSLDISESLVLFLLQQIAYQVLYTPKLSHQPLSFYLWSSVRAGVAKEMDIAMCMFTWLGRRCPELLWSRRKPASGHSRWVPRGWRLRSGGKLLLVRFVTTWSPSSSRDEEGYFQVRIWYSGRPWQISETSAHPGAYWLLHNIWEYCHIHLWNWNLPPATAPFEDTE